MMYQHHTKMKETEMKQPELGTALLSTLSDKCSGSTKHCGNCHITAAKLGK